MNKHILIGAMAAVTSLSAYAQAPAQTAPAQTQLIEKVTAKPGELIVTYEKYRLPNGLTVFIHEDHSDPIVHVDVTYHVGSARETPGKSGFAHFFEHMMFQGSDHVGDEEHMKIVQAAGGSYQGTTNHDRTNYYETMPKNYLETALWLESDRMGFLMDAVTQKKFEVQRSTVKNEKDQRVDNVPYGKLDILKSQALYPPKHPYSWPTIGYVEDLDRVNVEDLKNFFMRWYGPNNASLVIAGDVNPQEALKLAEKYFGAIPRGPEVKKQRVEPVRLAENVYINYGDNVYAPLMLMTFPTVPQLHADEAPLDLLAQVLGNGNNSIIYKKFVKSENALQAGSSHGVGFGGELAGEFSIYAVTYPGGEVDPEKLMRETIDEFDRTGVDDDALQRAKAQYASYGNQIMSSVEGKASALSQWFYLSPNKPFNLNDEFARYSKVTKEDVMRVFRQYIKGKNAAIVNIFPKQTNAAAAKEDTKTATSSGQASSELEYKGLSYTKPKENFDRSKKPEPAGMVVPVVPKFYKTKFDNGMNVIGSTTSEVPSVTLLFTIKGGNSAVNDPSKSGLAALTASMMEEATQKYTSEEFSNEFEKLGSQISFNAGRDATTIFVSTQKKNLDKTLELLEEKLLHPKFTAEDFKRNQKQNAENVNQQKVNGSFQASRAFSKLVFGKNMQAEPVTGSVKNIKGMSLKDVQSYYDKYYSPAVTDLIIVGDVTEQEIMPKLGFLKSWGKKDVTLPAFVPPAPVATQKTIYLVDKYKAAQSEIRVGYLAMPYDYNGKYFKARVMNFVFAGNFNSRLNLNLREDKGITYGIGGGFQGNTNPGPYGIGCGVRTSATDTAIREIFSEISKYTTAGITDEELAFTKKSLSEADALKYETQFDKAGFLGQLVTYNLPADFIEQQNRMLQTISKDEINGLAKELLPAEKMVIVVVGDKEKIQAPLEKLGYKVVDYKLD